MAVFELNVASRTDRFILPFQLKPVTGTEFGNSDISSWFEPETL